MNVARGTWDKGVPRGTREALERHVALLRRWNRRINLISPESEPDIWRRHVEDSLQLRTHMPQAEAAIDLGSGAGFPGLVLAIATGVHFHLVESDRRKAAFLAEAARAASAPATVHTARIEHATLPKVHVITARALAPLTRLLAYTNPHLHPDGVALFLKGEHVEAELAEAAAEGWRFSHQRHASLTGSGSVLVVTQIHRA